MADNAPYGLLRLVIAAVDSKDGYAFHDDPNDDNQRVQEQLAKSL